MSPETRDRPLEGRVVLVTRDARSARRIAAELEALGAEVEARPTISFEDPSDDTAARRAVERIETYDWVVFTSPNGVRFFGGRLARPVGSVEGLSARVATVGPGTARALEDLGIDVHVVAARSDAEGLARVLEDRVVAGQRVLWVRPERSREVLAERLRQAGAVVDAVAFYRTVANAAAGQVARDVAAGRYDAIVFTSPSNFRGLVEAAPGGGREALEEALRRTGRIAIGRVTSAAMLRAGMAPDVVADSPDERAIARAVLRRLR